MRISDWSSDVCSSDLVARLARRDRNGRGDLLAHRDAILERLDAMIDRVADDMDQRIADILHHFAVEFDLAAARLKGDLLAHVLREFADAARQWREQLAAALHPHLADRLEHACERIGERSEVHTSALQSLMRISSAVFCLNN